MNRIKIRNFGPIGDGFIDNDGWININKVTVFRSDGSTLRFRKQERIFKKYLEYHRIDSYLKKNTEIQYEGKAYRINYSPGKPLDIQKMEEEYTLPKITYFPAERNFVSSVKKSRSGQKLTLWSQSLQEFKETFQEAKEDFKEKETFHLPISNVELEYNKLNDVLYVKGPDYKIQLADSASGFQSFVPLFVVANYVSKLLEKEQEMDEQQRETFKKESAKILADKTYTEEQKRILLSNLAAQFNIKRTLNIIEEPEQNLFPTSQQKVINSLLEYNNAIDRNKLIITTHSPYIIGYMTLAVKAMELYKKAKKEEVRAQINEIVPQKSAISHDDLVIYELDEKDGSIRMLGSKNGIPNDNDYLDNALGIINEMFSDLLDIEDLCQ